MGATKIATGHNLDDEVQGIMMNYLEGNTDNLTKLGPKSESKVEEFTTKIKPLREIPEREIGLYVVAKELEVHFDSCPYAMLSFRGEVSEAINYSHGRCRRCGEPASNELCKACSFLEELGL